MKKNDIKIIIVTCILSILMLATLSACNTDESVGFHYDVVSFSDCSSLLYNLQIENQRIVRIDSLDQLIQLCEDAKMPINDKNNLDAYNSDLYKKLRSYDVSFFADKTLLILMKYRTHYEPVEFSNISIEGGVLTAAILNERHPFFNNNHYEEAEYAFISLIEIKSDYLLGVNEMIVTEYFYLNRG